MRLAIRLAIAMMSAVIASRGAGAQTSADSARAIADTNPRAANIFRRFSANVVKVQIVEKGAPAKATLGSGFLVDDSGTVVTNYHVIAKLVQRPARYRAEVLGLGDTTIVATLVAIDVIHDLAVLRTGVRSPGYFRMLAAPLSRGDRLFSLGHPKDLGLSIIEGTYNGLLDYRLYPKIHFSGSLNPGMSGGPAVDGGGNVVGVNVSTEGEQVSYLVPAAAVVELLARVRTPGFTPPTDFLGDLGKQIHVYQDAYLKEMIAADIPTITVGEFVLPTAPKRFFRCWADASSSEDKPYRVSYHRCSTDDELFITDEQWTGIVEVRHRYFTSTELNALQFSSLYTYQFDAKEESWSGDEEFVTSFACQTNNVKNGAAVLRTAFCVRSYRKLPGLYDAVLRVAVLGGKEHRGAHHSSALGRFVRERTAHFPALSGAHRVAREVVVEVLDGRGRVHSRTRVSQFPATVGRAYSSDIIVEDEYVDPHHLRIVQEQDATLVIEDAGSVNGTFESGSAARATRVALRPGLQLRIGGTHLRFHDPEQPVAPARLQRAERSYTRLGSPQIAVPVVLVAGVIFTVSSWLGTYERTTLTKQLAVAVTAVLLLCVWAGAWALASRLIQHRFNFRAHLTLALLAMLLLNTVTAVATWVSVVTPGSHLGEALDWAGSLPLMFALISGHLALASTMSARARYRTTAGIMLSIAALGGLYSWSARDDFSTQLKYPSAIRPVPVTMLSTETPDEFFRDATDLRKRVDELAAKANRKQSSRSR